MNSRINRLREQSIGTKPYVSVERACLMTKFYKNILQEEVSIPVKRALSFKYLMENKEIWVGEGELIVGERGPAPLATSTYPEICTHSLKDLDIIHSREKVSFNVDEKTRELYKKEIIPYWRGKSIRDRIFNEMPEEWMKSYNAGVFTEFQEQRAPGHTVLGNKIYNKGFKDLKDEIDEALNGLDYYNDPMALDKKEELLAMKIAADTLINFARRHTKKILEIAGKEKNTQRKNELKKMAQICNRIPENKPETFWEALQYYWFVHLGVVTELNPWDSFNPGRLDQHLNPFYSKEIEDGNLTSEGAKELLQAFWIKFNNHPSPPKMGVTASESNTYTDFALINTGGIKEDGSDAVNELSYLILDVIEEMRILQPSSMVQISKKTPDLFLKKAINIIKTGFGQPSIFNTDTIVQELIRQGKSVEDARNGGASGCVETGAFGKECYILTGYFNLAKVLEITLYDGKDPLTGKQLGLNTGNAKGFKDFDKLLEVFTKQLNYFINIKIKGNNIIERLYAKYMPVPFLSLLIDDCIKNGRDYNGGGARYNTNYIQGVGLGSITDSLVSLKYNVFDKKNVSMEEMLQALENNYEGFDSLLNMVLNHTPKFGNDNEYADGIMREVFESFYEAVNGRPNFKGGKYRINLLPTTCHVYFGSKINALPDGRKAYKPLSEGISPVQGADRNGPTSVLKSAAKIDHIKTGGTLLNQKFTPQLLSDDEGINKFAQMIRTYFRMDGHHIQFNVVTADTLRKAQENPNKYNDLIVRVAGYSDYFNALGKELQDEIIKRTEHEGF